MIWSSILTWMSKIDLWTHITESTECWIPLQCKVFDISALIGQKIKSKSKWWILIFACKWVPSVEFDFDVCVDSRQCLTDTLKLNSTLGTFSDICLSSKIVEETKPIARRMLPGISTKRWFIIWFNVMTAGNLIKR